MDQSDDEPPFGDDKSNSDDAFDRAITELELAMIRKPLVPDFEIKDEYMAGYIEAMYVHGKISDLEKALLNMMYCERLI